MAKKIELVTPTDVTPITKPDTAFSLDKFKSKRAAVCPRHRRGSLA
jgi:hypothetical protein